MKVYHTDELGLHIPVGNAYSQVTIWVFREDNTAFEWQKPTALLEHKMEGKTQ
jgi:hypothetical protein